MFAKRNLEIIRLQDELQRNMQICIDLQEARQEARGEDADIDAAMFKFADPIPRFSSTRSRLEYDLKELKNKYLKLENDVARLLFRPSVVISTPRLLFRPLGCYFNPRAH